MRSISIKNIVVAGALAIAACALRLTNVMASLVSAPGARVPLREPAVSLAARLRARFEAARLHLSQEIARCGMAAFD